MRKNHQMPDDDLVFLAYADLSGHVRGRAVPGRRYPTTVGWVPADQSITPFGSLGEMNPYGPLGDLRLIPDESAHIRADRLGATAFDVVLCDAVEPDGQPFAACPRAALRAAIERLAEQHRLEVKAAFEHEFTMLDAAGTEAAPLPAFSLQAQRSAEPFGSDLVRCMNSAGLEPENWLAEFAPGQFEITVTPANALRAADRASLVREIVRDVARVHQRAVTFSPMTSIGGVGNGVHVHLSLHTGNGKPVTHDRHDTDGLSRQARAFFSGIIRHLPALVALTAPSAISYLRLMPHRWSAAFTASGLRNREAALRICPGATPAGWNIEFRAADATACPHLVLAALIHAGCQGLDEGLDELRLLPGDPNAMSGDDLAAMGVVRLPTSLPEALDAFGDDGVARRWFDPLLIETYLEMKHTELTELADLSDAARIARYRAVY